MLSVLDAHRIDSRLEDHRNRATVSLFRHEYGSALEVSVNMPMSVTINVMDDAEGLGKQD